METEHFRDTSRPKQQWKTFWAHLLSQAVTDRSKPVLYGQNYPSFDEKYRWNFRECRIEMPVVSLLICLPGRKGTNGSETATIASPGPPLRAELSMFCVNYCEPHPHQAWIGPQCPRWHSYLPHPCRQAPA